MQPFFICNQDEVETKIRSLIESGTSTDGWTQYYFDKINNEEWHLTRYESEYHGGGIPVLKRLPEPTIEGLIDIAMTSLDTNDIIGASLELRDREKNNNEEFREKLITSLLKLDTSKITDFDKERLRLIIYESDLYDSTNRRGIVGKHFTEIQSDSDYYKTISQKSIDILTQIGKYSR
jgi:hypothetical protein